MITKPFALNVPLVLLAAICPWLSFCPSTVIAAEETGAAGITGFVEENITIPVKNFENAVIKIDNKSVVIDGFWEFKDSAGEVLEKPKILSQPADLTDKVVLALRSPGTANISVTEDGETKVYKISVKSRFRENEIEKELETAILQFVGDPGLKVTVLPPQSSLVGANMRRAFGDETASEIVAPRGQAAGSSTGTVTSASDYRPVIVLEGELLNDLRIIKAINVAHAYTENVINLMSARNIIQVQIKVNVLSVQVSKTSNIGMRYGTRSAAGVFTSGLTLPLNVQEAFSAGAPFFNVINTNAVGDFQAQLNAAITRGDVKVLQSPTITVMNGQPAEFIAGSIVSIPTSVTIDNGVTTQEFSQQAVGVTLRISPITREEAVFRTRTDGTIPFSTISTQDRRITRAESDTGAAREQVVNSIDENGVVRLLIQPSVSSLGATAVNGVIPVNTNQMETRVALKDRSTLVIGGLFTSEDRKNMEAIPFIEKIPILGELFKNRNNTDNRNELVFTLTPCITGLSDFSEVNDRSVQGAPMRREMQTVGINSKPVRISAREVFVREPARTVPSTPGNFNEVGVRPLDANANVAPATSNAGAAVVPEEAKMPGLPNNSGNGTVKP
ncbi:MAG: type II and III secretion system protein [Candidatus Methylacidiphilales bacterium]|nr:type II and III secretion system protein [Candidatus Methylacidiphilales bacterium]